MAIALDTLAYARRLRESGLSQEQAEGLAEALAAAMSDSLATKQDLLELEARIDARFEQIAGRFAQAEDRFAYLEKHFDTRLIELEKRLELRMDSRFAEHEARFDAKLADLERRMTMRLGGITVAGISVVSVLVKLL